MIEPKLKLNVVKKGTHNLSFERLNNDVPNPAECVAEALADLEYRIAELIKRGGYDPTVVGSISLDAYAFDTLISSVKNLNATLNAATKQDWQLELERNPDVVTHMAMDVGLPVDGCDCDICQEVREHGPVNSETWCSHRRELLKAGQI